MAWFKGRGPWVYLGHSIIKYVDEKGDTSTECAIQFYARGDDLKSRKCEHPGWADYRAEAHPFWQQRVIPWLGGDNLYDGIKVPSDNLKKIAKDQHGYEFIGKKWVKPAPKYEKSENVLSITAHKSR